MFLFNPTWSLPPRNVYISILIYFIEYVKYCPWLHFKLSQRNEECHLLYDEVIVYYSYSLQTRRRNKYEDSTKCEALWYIIDIRLYKDENVQRYALCAIRGVWREKERCFWDIIHGLPIIKILDKNRKKKVYEW